MLYRPRKAKGDSMETKALSETGVQVTLRYVVNNQESIAQVDKFPYLIGRDSSSVQLALPDATVSRIHVRLSCQDGAVWLENVSATNKTAVNGQYIQRPVQLNTGDTAILGSSQLLFDIRSCAESENAQPPEPVETEVVTEPVPASDPPMPSRSAPNDMPEAEARFCYECGSPLRRGAVSCSECGAAVNAEITGTPMFCGFCGVKVSEYAKFCPMCGRPTRQGKSGGKATQNTAGPESRSASEQRNKKSLVPIIVGAAVLITVFIVAVVLLADQGYKKQLVGSWYINGTTSITRDGDRGPAFTLYSDGTCKIATEYGTGRWAVVNDNQLKLTNFYGESDTKTIKSLKNGCLIMEDGTVYWSSVQ